MLAFSCALFVSSASAQVTSGSVYGTVADSSGAVIPGASVIVTNVLTSVSKTTRTDSSGDYSFPVLDPGDYRVIAQMTGFQSQTQENIRLDSNQNVHVSFALKAGSTEQNVTVEAQTALVDTRESQIGTTVDQKRIQDLPLNGRNAYDLVPIVPGVTNYVPDVATGSRAGTQLTVNGITRGTAFYLDGAYNTDVQLGGNLLPNPDALQEFRVLTSNFDAEFGRLAGGVVIALTRSGTSQYHGLAYDYLRNNIFNAKNWFLSSVTPLHQNQFGGDIAGPVPLTDGHGFFLFTYQGLRTRQPANVASSSLITPTALERTGDFRATPAALRPNISCQSLGIQYKICPDKLDPVAQNILAFVPLGDPTQGMNYGHPPEQAADANIDTDQEMVRVDYQPGHAQQLSGMYFQSRGTANRPTLGGNQIVDYSGMQNYEGQYNAVASDIWTISPTKVNSLRAYYSLNHYIVGNIYGNQHLLPDLGSQAAMGSSYSTQPYFNIAGYWQMGGNIVGPANSASTSLGFSNTFNWVRGRHEFKFGGTYIWHHYSNTGAGASNGIFSFDGSITGNPLADFLYGMAKSLMQDNGVFLRNHAYDPALFVQDNWRITRRLTLNLGLRWEYYPPLTGQNNTGTFVAGVQSTRFPTAPLGLLTSGDKGIPDGVLHTPWNTFAPRFGFAYDLFGTGSASLRGAYGIFYSPLDQTPLVRLLQQPFSRSITASRTLNLVTPFAPNQDPFPYNLSPSNTAFLSGASIFSLPPGVSSIPSVQQFSLGIQQQYNSNWSSEINYVGNVARHLLITFDENSPIYNPLCTSSTCNTPTGQNNRRPYQPPGNYTFASISLSAPVANSSYHSLQATLARRFDKHFSVQTSFVWSKVIGYGPLTNAYDLNSSRGVVDFNVPYNFVASYIFVSPEVHHLGFVGTQLLSGWQVNGVTLLRSGQPFNVTSGVDTNFDGTNNDRPNVVGNPHLPPGRGRVATKNAFFNTAAFVTPPAGTPYGNAPFNLMYGPNYVDTDLSAFKKFPIERGTLEFRGEVFNIFNNVNMSAPNGTKSSPAFGTISAAGAPRIVQLALRLSF